MTGNRWFSHHHSPAYNYLDFAGFTDVTTVLMDFTPAYTRQTRPLVVTQPPRPAVPIAEIPGCKPFDAERFDSRVDYLAGETFPRQSRPDTRDIEPIFPERVEGIHMRCVLTEPL